MSISIFSFTRRTSITTAFVFCGVLQGFAQDSTAPATERGLTLIYGSEGVDQDINSGVAILSEAAANGDVAAQRELGQQLIGGWVMPRDVERGRPMLEAAAAAGDAKARRALGSFLHYGVGLPRDMKAALVLFEQLADQGDGSGLRIYGETLMWSLRDPAQAEAYLTRAGELGEGSAWSVLAEGAMYGYLGNARMSRAKFDGFANRARAADDERIEVLDATRQMWGISMIASGPKTLEKLKAAADKGNTSAARFLISLVRDGNSLNIRKAPAQAEILSDRYAGLLTEDEKWQFDFSIAAAKTKQIAAFGSLKERLTQSDRRMDERSGRDLYKANPNFVIYLLQGRMKEAGIYRGSLDGLAGQKTVNGLMKACLSMLEDADCDDIVLDADLISALVTATQAPKSNG